MHRILVPRQDAVLKLISVFTKDDRYYDAIRTKKKKGEKPKNMCEVYDKIEQRGIKSGIQRELKFYFILYLL